MNKERLRKRRAFGYTLVASAFAFILGCLRAKSFVLVPAWSSAAFGNALVCGALLTFAALLATKQLAREASRAEPPLWAPFSTFGWLSLLAVTPFFAVFDGTALPGVERSAVDFATMFYWTFATVLLSIALVVAVLQRKDAQGYSPKLARILTIVGIVFIFSTIGIAWLVFVLNLHGL